MSSNAKTAKLTLTTQQQTLEQVHAVVSHILNLAGCRGCGRLINLELQFLGDPAPDLAKGGVVSMHTEGF